MGQKLRQAHVLDALASAAPTLAEAQALHARADQLRRDASRPWFSTWTGQPLIRN
jgi:hypothetical protein